VDGCGGDEEDAVTSLVVQDTFVETRCAKEHLFEDFQDDFDSDWGQAAKTGGARYIGPLGKNAPGINMEFDVPTNAEQLTVEFLFYEFDEWTSDDKLLVTIGDVILDLKEFSQFDPVDNPNNEQNGKFEGVIWSRFSMTKSEDIVLGGGKDQVSLQGHRSSQVLSGVFCVVLTSIIGFLGLSGPQGDNQNPTKPISRRQTKL